MIQFECPHCQAVLRVPDSAMGQRGKCPKCAQAVLVPVPPGWQAPPASTAATAAASAARNVPAAPVASGLSSLDLGADAGTVVEGPKSDIEAVSELFSAVEAGKSGVHRTDPLVAVTRKTRARNQGSLVTAILFLGIAVAAGIGAYFFLQPRYEGTLAAQLTTSEMFPPKRISRQALGNADLFPQFLKEHANDRIRINSQLLLTSLEAVSDGLEITIMPASRCDIYRVNLLGHAGLASWHVEHYAALEAARTSEIQTASREFFEQMAESEKILRSNPVNLLQYRDRIILPAAVDALGFHVAAFVGPTQYPCIWQDKADQFYFAVPQGTKSFEIRPRLIAGKPVLLPSGLKFTVTTDRTTTSQPNEYNYDFMLKQDSPAQKEEPAPPATDGDSNAPAPDDVSAKPEVEPMSDKTQEQVPGL